MTDAIFRVVVNGEFSEVVLRWAFEEVQTIPCLWVVLINTYAMHKEFSEAALFKDAHET